MIQIQDSIYSDQIFHQKIISFIRFVFLFCTMPSIILFLSEKNKHCFRKEIFHASDKQKYMCTNPTDGLEMDEYSRLLSTEPVLNRLPTMYTVWD